jgi:arylsulfatase A-like enzyme
MRTMSGRTRFALLGFLLVSWVSLPATAKPTNVLFIAVDDLRPALGCYGDPLAKTPNIDALAKRGLVFKRAYCQQAVCSPSRTSLLTGRRPDTTKIYNLQDHFRTTIPDVVTLPQHFKDNGYHAQAFGKIFHGGLDDPKSWSVPATGVQAPNYSPAVNAVVQKKRKAAAEKGLQGQAMNRASKGIAWESVDTDDDDSLNDGDTATRAIGALREIRDKPFFLAVGFIKPHLPFVAPKKYFDLHPPESFKVAPNKTRPSGAPDVAFTNFAELRAYEGMPKNPEPMPDAQALELIRAYYAAASYMDAQVGRLLAELDALKLRDDTIVILWGDHGWHLGEQGMWCKHTNFENAARAPLIVSQPAQKTAGQKTDALVEFVDIYPTLVELAGLMPADGLEGTSLAPLIAEPSNAWKSAAFSQYPRQGGVMGYSMRTDRYRYTEWQDKEGKVLARELYDHQADPAETRNVAEGADQTTVIAELSKKLKDGWRAAKPQGS